MKNGVKPPCAFITPAPGQEETLSSDDILSWCRDNLASYKIPKTVVFGSLPKPRQARFKNSYFAIKLWNCKCRKFYSFPGPGCAVSGIGSDLIREFPTAAAVYETASSVLGYDMIKLSSDESSADMNLTRYNPACPPDAFLCMSSSILGTCFRSNSTIICLWSQPRRIQCAGRRWFARYRIWVAFGVSTGRVYGEHGGGEMLALPLSEEQLQPLVDSSPCEIAACNLPDQTVVGGWPAELDHFAAELETAFLVKQERD